MKKYLLVLFLLMSLTSSAQSLTNEGSTYPIYCIVYGYIGWDDELNAIISMNQKEKMSYLCNMEGQPIAFNSVPQIINYMAKLGWVYVDNVTIQNSLRFIMKKMVKSDEEALEKMKIMTKDEIRKARKEKGLD